MATVEAHEVERDWIRREPALRFEWGFPFRPLPYEESYTFELTIGNFF
ncbi:MAG: hypothetical protein IT374_12005 [Polyangiaceae bacterium]|nr:hypothetical protein [Polyangiaceae bacterium]